MLHQLVEDVRPRQLLGGRGDLQGDGGPLMAAAEQVELELEIVGVFDAHEHGGVVGRFRLENLQQSVSLGGVVNLDGGATEALTQGLT